MHGISAFILTYNSEKYLERILSKLSQACSEIVIVDSGSADSTKMIGEKFGCRILFRKLDNFKNQRTFAVQHCAHNLVLMIDSDEVPDDELVRSLNELKVAPAYLQAYRIRREWVVLGKKIHAVYPVVSPDFPVRLFDKRFSNFENSPVVHEEPAGYKSAGVLGGTLRHYTFENRQEMAQKLERYTSLSALTLRQKQKNTGILQQWLSSVAAFMKWYFVKGGWKDGITGIILARYAFDYTFLKYAKARRC